MAREASPSERAGMALGSDCSMRHARPADAYLLELAANGAHAERAGASDGARPADLGKWLLIVSIGRNLRPA